MRSLNDERKPEAEGKILKVINNFKASDPNPEPFVSSHVDADSVSDGDELFCMSLVSDLGKVDPNKYLDLRISIYEVFSQSKSGST